jgi:hypothetical protein
MHLNDGQIRASLDHEASEQELAHLERCKRCQERWAFISGQANQVSQSFSVIKPPDLEARTSVPNEGARLATYIRQKETQSMGKKIFSRNARPVWIGLGLVAVLAVAMAFQPVRAIANNFLGLFRVEQVVVVQVNPMNLPQVEADSANLEAIFTEDMQVTAEGELQTAASAEEASVMAGISVRLPTEAIGDLSLEVQPPAQMTFQVNLAHVQAVLDELGLSDIDLPEGVDGAVVTVDIPSIVNASYGDCRMSEAVMIEKIDPDDPSTYQFSGCTHLAQMTSPTISAPPGVDLQQIGQAYLELLGMDSEEAARFSQNIDWSTTLVLPLPIDGYEYSEVPVDGVTGTLIHSTGEGNRNLTLLWVKEGITYVLTGSGSTYTALGIANSLQ